MFIIVQSTIFILEKHINPVKCLRRKNYPNDIFINGILCSRKKIMFTQVNVQSQGKQHIKEKGNHILLNYIEKIRMYTWFFKFFISFLKWSTMYNCFISNTTFSYCSYFKICYCQTIESKNKNRGTWVAQSIKHPTLDFSSGHDLKSWKGTTQAPNTRRYLLLSQKAASPQMNHLIYCNNVPCVQFLITLIITVFVSFFVYTFHNPFLNSLLQFQSSFLFG